MHMHLICRGACIVHCPRQAYNINREIEKLIINQLLSQLAVHRHDSVLSRDQSQLQASQRRIVRDFVRQFNYGNPVPGQSQLPRHGQYFDRRNPQSTAFGQNVEHPFSAHWQDRPQWYRQQCVGQFQGHVSDRDRFYRQSTTYNERPGLEQPFQQRPEFYQIPQIPFNIEASPQYSFEQRLQQSYEQSFESLSYRPSTIHNHNVNERLNQGPVNGQTLGQPNCEQRYPYHHSGQIFPQQEMMQRFPVLNYGQTHPQSEFGWTHSHSNFGHRDLGERRPQQCLRHHLLQPDIAQNQHFQHRYSQQFMGERYPPEHNSGCSRRPELDSGGNTHGSFRPRYPQQNIEQTFQQRNLRNRPQLRPPKSRRSHSNFEQTIAQPNYGPRFAQPDSEQLVIQPNVVQPNVRPTTDQIDLMHLLTEPTQPTLPDQLPLADTSLYHPDLGQVMNQSNLGQVMNQSNFEQVIPQPYLGLNVPQTDFDQSEQRHCSERAIYEQPENISYRQVSLNAGPSQLPNQNLQHPFNRNTPQETVFQAPENRPEAPQPIHSQNFEQLNNEDNQQHICAPSAASIGEGILQKTGYEPLQPPIYPLGSYAYNTHTFAKNEELFRADGSQLFGSVSSKEPNDEETAPIAQPIAESLRPSNVQTHEDSQKIQSMNSIVRNSRRSQSPSSSSSDRQSYENFKELQTPQPVMSQNSKEARRNELTPSPLDLFDPENPEKNRPLRPVKPAFESFENPDESLSPNIYQTLNTVQFCDLTPIDPDSIDHNRHRQVGYHSPVFSEEARHSGHNRPISSVSVFSLSSESSDDSSSPRYFKALCLAPVNCRSPQEDIAKSYETGKPSKSNNTPSPGSLDSKSPIHPEDHQTSGLISTLSSESVADQSPERPDESSSPDIYLILNTMSSCHQPQIEQENLNHDEFGLLNCHSPVFSEEARSSWPIRPMSSVCIDTQISERSDAPSYPQFFQGLRLLPVSDQSPKEPPNNEPSPDNLDWNSPINIEENERLGYIRQPSPVRIVDQSPEQSDQSLSPKIYQTLDLVQFGCLSPNKSDKTMSPQTSRAKSPEPEGNGPQDPDIQQRSDFSDPQQVVDEQLHIEHDEIKCNLI